MEIHFTKMSGTGNDFILIDNRKGDLDPDHLADWVARVCRRRLSVGADGVILIEASERADFRWRFFNADGGEAEMCGNGGRCAVRFARIKGIVQKDQVAFETLAGIVRGELFGNRVKIQLTQPSKPVMELTLQVNGRYITLHSINTGVPHAIQFVDDIDDLDVVQIGRAVRLHSHFAPQGTNMNFVRVLEGGTLVVRTYERGVEDETLACGTGCVASALLAGIKGFSTSPVKVLTRSGEKLIVYFSTDGERFAEVYLEGGARVIYEGIMDPEALE
ncbi:MAG: diaminopimelate epimerase [Deltaproteobacteria bacterium]|nr:diaminopimelate epimerase [Deltaproteobacteria bacterium]MBW2306442.1 diaminopimelate epimerase [Deltaproteobacteria bacterium]